MKALRNEKCEDYRALVASLQEEFRGMMLYYARLDLKNIDPLDSDPRDVLRRIVEETNQANAIMMKFLASKVLLVGLPAFHGTMSEISKALRDFCVRTNDVFDKQRNRR